MIKESVNFIEQLIGEDLCEMEGNEDMKMEEELSRTEPTEAETGVVE